LKAGCLLTIPKISVTIKILSTTELSKVFLKTKSGGKFDFGENLSLPKEE